MVSEIVDTVGFELPLEDSRLCGFVVNYTGTIVRGTLLPVHAIGTLAK